MHQQALVLHPWCLFRSCIPYKNVDFKKEKYTCWQAGAKVTELGILTGELAMGKVVSFFYE
jgi:hypothetical protein